LQIGVTVTGRIAQRSSARQRIYENTIESLLVRLNREHGGHLHIFAQCNGPGVDHDDRIAAHRLYTRLKQHTDQISLWDTFRDALEIKAAYARMDCMIGTRMHTAIFATSNGVPVILIGYQPKAFGVMEWLGLGEYCCNIETITTEQLYGLARETLENREEIRQHVIARYAEMQARLEGWTRYLGI
jgi:colanic acid/amylovoran biosynthesis protein